VFWFCHAYGLRDRQTHRRDYFREKIEMEFEGFSFWAPIGYDYVLKELYGDYMQLPPESERFPSHPTSELVL
jgi:lipopolysaccharide cholinephosphotransferase